MKSIDKREFASKLSKKIKRAVSITHINSVINLLCEDLLQELKKSGEFQVGNFGTFELVKKPKSYFDVLKQEIKTSEGNKRIKFKLSRKFKKKIAKLVDLEKTIGDENGKTS